MKRLFIIFALCACLHPRAEAQSYEIVSGNSSGFAMQVIDSAKRISLVGAHVTLISDKDTVRSTTGSNGYYYCYEPLGNPVRLMVSYMGYETLDTEIMIPSDIIVRLPEKKYDLTELVVKGDAIAVITKGDTVQFNAAAFTTMDGDVMTQLFEKLPGMKIEGNKLTYLGEEIDRITIDNQRLFGNNVMLALENIRSDDVENVKVYKQLKELDSLQNVKNAKPETVADVTTKSKPKMIRNRNLKASVGAELERGERKVLYDASGNLVHSRVGETLTANAAVTTLPPWFIWLSDINKISGNLDYIRAEKGKYFIATKNSINLVRQTNEKWSESVYFPTSDYASRDYISRNRNDTRKNDFSTNNDLRKIFKNKSMLSGGISFDYTDDLQKSRDIISAMQDGVQTQNRDIEQRDKIHSYKLRTSLSYNKSFRSKMRLYVILSADLNKNNGDGWRVDTLASSSSHVYLENSSSGKSGIFEGYATLSIPLADQLSLDFTETLTYTNSLSKRTALDVLNGLTDITNTFDYRTNELKNKSSAKILYRDFTKQKGFSELSAEVAWLSRDIRRDEYFPKEYDYPRTFNYIEGRVSAEYKFSMFNKISFSISRSAKMLFNLTDLRDALDDSNPVMLRAGNPDLDIPMSNYGDVGFTFIKNSSTYQVRIAYSIQEKSIANKKRYFATDTFLPEYDYTAQAGSSLITLENVGLSHYLRMDAKYSVRSKKLKSTYNVDLTYQYVNNPEFWNEERVSFISHKVTARLGIRGNFSSAFEPSVNVSTEYSNMYNGKIRNKALAETLNVSFRALIAKVIEIDNSNDFIWNLNWPTIRAIDRFGLISNISVGYRIKEGLSVKVMANDLFNKKNRLVVDTYADYNVTSYNYRLARHILFGVEWKF